MSHVERFPPYSILFSIPVWKCSKKEKNSDVNNVVDVAQAHATSPISFAVSRDAMHAARRRYAMHPLVGQDSHLVFSFLTILVHTNQPRDCGKQNKIVWKLACDRCAANLPCSFRCNASFTRLFYTV